MGKPGVILACYGGRTLKEKFSGIFIGMYFSGGGHCGKIWPHPSALRSPGQIIIIIIIQVGSQPHPSVKKLPKNPRHTTTSNLTQRQSSTYQRDRNQPHLPVGRHQSLPSGSLQQTPVPTSAIRGADTRNKRAHNSTMCTKKLH